MVTLFLFLKYPYNVFYGFQLSDKILHFAYCAKYIKHSILYSISDPLFSKVPWICFYCLLFLLVSIYIVMSSSMSVPPPRLCPQCCTCFAYRNNLKSRMVLSFSTKKLYWLFQALTRTSIQVKDWDSETELQALWGSMYTSNGSLLLRCSSGSISPNTMQGKQGILPFIGPRYPYTNSCLSPSKLSKAQLNLLIILSELTNNPWKSHYLWPYFLSYLQILPTSPIQLWI